MRPGDRHRLAEMLIRVDRIGEVRVVNGDAAAVVKRSLIGTAARTCVQAGIAARGAADASVVVPGEVASTPLGPAIAGHVERRDLFAGCERARAGQRRGRVVTEGVVQFVVGARHQHAGEWVARDRRLVLLIPRKRPIVVEIDERICRDRWSLAASGVSGKGRHHRKHPGERQQSER